MGNETFNVDTVDSYSELTFVQRTHVCGRSKCVVPCVLLTSREVGIPKMFKSRVG